MDAAFRTEIDHRLGDPSRSQVRLAAFDFNRGGWADAVGGWLGNGRTSAEFTANRDCVHRSLNRALREVALLGTAPAWPWQDLPHPACTACFFRVPTIQVPAATSATTAHAHGADPVGRQIAAAEADPTRILSATKSGRNQ